MCRRIRRRGGKALQHVFQFRQDLWSFMREGTPPFRKDAMIRIKTTTKDALYWIKNDPLSLEGHHFLEDRMERTEWRSPLVVAAFVCVSLFSSSP